MKKILFALLITTNIFAQDYMDGDLCGFLNYQRVESFGMTYTLNVEDDPRLFVIENYTFSGQMATILMNHDWDRNDEGAMVCFYDANAVEVDEDVWSIEYFEDLEEIL